MAAQITALPTPPTRQDPTNFNDRADAFLAALPRFQSEANSLSTELNTRADNVQSSDLAVLAATNITKWVSGTTYTEGAVVWSPINGLGYRRITASGSETTDPSLDSTNYKQVNGTGNLSTNVNGNLGIGANPYNYTNSRTFAIGGSESGSIDFIASNIGYGYNRAARIRGESSGIITFSTGTNDVLSEKARFTNNGYFLFNTTSAAPNNSHSAAFNLAGFDANLQLNHASGSSTSAFVSFNYAGNSIGSVSRSGTTAVAYNTSSDYRLKHDIAPIQNALQRVAALKPCTYKWNADNSDGEGFIAHELAEVCPSAVTGEKDAVDADGNPVYQGIDTSFLVATLTAAIQEQQKMIDELRGRIEVLESK